MATRVDGNLRLWWRGSMSDLVVTGQEAHGYTAAGGRATSTGPVPSSPLAFPMSDQSSRRRASTSDRPLA
jgi:hypothetical protein